MPSGPQSKGPRLWLRPERVRAGRSPEPAVWIIRDDGGSSKSTGCAAGDRSGAEQALAAYITSKYRPAPGKRDPSQRLTTEVLRLFLNDVGKLHARPKETKARIDRLGQWWGLPVDGRTGYLSDINTATCRAYIAHVGARRSASMDLELLRAAMNHAVKEQMLDRVVPVTLPEKSLPRERWLTRSEVARMVWAAWRFRREQASGEDDWGARKHIARFILMAHYTGTRKTAILLASFERVEGFGYIDLAAGLWYRRPVGAAKTTKRQPAIPIPRPLLAHMKRWRKNGQRFPVEFRGQPVERIDKAYRLMVAKLELGDDVVIHTLRHTAITWGLQRGMEPFDASGYFGVSLDVLMATYGHHCPTHLQAAAERMARPVAHKVPTKLAAKA